MKPTVIFLALAALPLFAAPTPPGQLLQISQGYFDLYAGGQTREKELKGFEGQGEALGYVPGETFAVPPALKDRVDFWKRIYSEYTTSEAVLHDMEYPRITYGSVDLSALEGLSYRHRQKQRQKLLDAAKDKVVAQLRQLQSFVDHPAGVPAELLPLYKKFEKVPGHERFADAIDRIRAQIGQRDRVVQGFFYGGRYFDRMMDIFSARHLPKELTRLPLVESAFNPGARSKVGASGIWQFMRSTGRLFLHINRTVDERNDPLTATSAAADLLQGNFEALQSWPLAITAYNHGREGMLRAVRTTSTTDLGEIIERYHGPAFGFASSNFYSEFLAILEVERDYRKYFGKLMVDSPREVESFPIADNVRFGPLASACGMDRDDLAALNPSLTDWAVSGGGYVPRGFRLRVTNGHVPRCRARYPLIAKVTPPARTTLARARVHRRRHRRTSRT